MSATLPWYHSDDVARPRHVAQWGKCAGTGEVRADDPTSTPPRTLGLTCRRRCSPAPARWSN